MALTALDIIVLILVGGSAILGVVRGFVTEALSLLAWVAIIFVLKFFHLPLSHALAGKVGTDAGAAVLAFAILSGVTYFGGRLIANALGARTRTSILGPLDRALGLGFGVLKGLIFASLGFLLITLVIDTMGGGPAQRPEWMTKSRTYPLLNITSASMSAFVDRRRKGEPMFGDSESAAARDDADNAILARHKR